MSEKLRVIPMNGEVTLCSKSVNIMYDGYFEPRVYLQLRYIHWVDFAITRPVIWVVLGM